MTDDRNVTRADAGSAPKPLAVSIARARELLGIGNTLAWELIRDGRLRTIRINRRRLVLYESIEALLKSAAA